MMATAATTAGNPNLMKSLPYDSLKDFAPAGFIGSLQFVLLTRNEPGSATLADFIKRAKGATPPLTSGAGTPSARVCTATLGERIGAELVYVPYKAAPLALADMLSGQIDMTFGDVSIAVPQVKAGKVKALVLASDSPSVLLPGVPTFEEAGLGQFSLDAWFVLLVPAKTPAGDRRENRQGGAGDRDRPQDGRSAARNVLRAQTHGVGRRADVHRVRDREMGPSCQGRRHREGMTP